MHKLEGDGLRGWLSLASWLNNLEAPKVLPLELGEGKHHDARKRKIEHTSELNKTSSKMSSLELFSRVDSNIRHLFYKIEKVRINIDRENHKTKHHKHITNTSHGIHKSITSIQG